MYRMKQLLMVIVLLSAAICAMAADGNRLASDGMFIATTGRIVMIDAKNRTFTVRGSDGPAIRDFARAKHVTSPVIILPGGFSIHFPGRIERNPARTNGSAPNLDEYTVVITDKTVFQDGAESRRLEDFTVGETISIHGVLAGNTLTASRIAKWS
jgi:Domain of unknown function (DUF5666)